MSAVDDTTPEAAATPDSGNGRAEDPDRGAFWPADHPLWGIAFKASTMATVAPLWIASHLPLGDLPQHVATMATLAHWFDPTWHAQQTYVLQLARTQYLLYYLSGAVLTAIVGSAERANLILLSMIAVTFPLSLRALLRALGRDERLALFGSALFWNYILFVGLLNSLAAIPIVLWGIALVVTHSQAPSRKGAVRLALCSLALFYLSVFALVYFGAACALTAWWFAQGSTAPGAGIVAHLRRRAENTVRSLLWLAPVGVVGALWTVLSPVVHHSRFGLSYSTAHFSSLASSLDRLPRTLMNVWHGSGDEVCAILLVLAALMVAWPRARTVDHASLHRTRLVLVLVLAALGLYLAMPEDLGPAIAFVKVRYPIYAALIAPALLVVPRRSKAADLGLVLAAVSALGAGGYASWQFRRFDREVGEFDRVLAAAKPGRRMLGLIYEHDSYVVGAFPPFPHFHAYYRARYGGVAEYWWGSVHAHMPIRYRDDAAPPVQADKFEWTPQLYNNAKSGPYYDYVLSRGNTGIFEAATRVGPQWKLVIARDKWALWERTGETLTKPASKTPVKGTPADDDTTTDSTGTESPDAVPTP